MVNIQKDGIKDVDDLEMVDKDLLKQLTCNLKHPGRQINVGGTMVATPDLKFGAKL